MRKNLTILFAIIILGILIWAAYSRNNIGWLPGNPASINCVEKGGVSDIRTSEDGSQYGVCKFSDGTECEEWAYFRGTCAPGREGPGVANPASVYCVEKGGALDIREEEKGQYGVCKFADGTECGEWEYFRGTCAPGQYQKWEDR
jgi:putative hemolysin